MASFPLLVLTRRGAAPVKTQTGNHFPRKDFSSETSLRHPIIRCPPLRCPLTWRQFRRPHGEQFALGTWSHTKILANYPPTTNHFIRGPIAQIRLSERVSTWHREDIVLGGSTPLALRNTSKDVLPSRQCNHKQK